MKRKPFLDLDFFNGRLVTWPVRASFKLFSFNSLVDSGTDISIVTDRGQFFKIQVLNNLNNLIWNFQIP